jgi:hypothetical protein
MSRSQAPVGRRWPEDVECPSPVADGSRIAFKKHGDLPAGQWRLHVLDLSSGKQTPLAEVRSVDDQWCGWTTRT